MSIWYDILLFVLAFIAATMIVLAQATILIWLSDTLDSGSTQDEYVIGGCPLTGQAFVVPVAARSAFGTMPDCLRADPLADAKPPCDPTVWVSLEPSGSEAPTLLCLMFSEPPTADLIRQLKECCGVAASRQLVDTSLDIKLAPDTQTAVLDAVLKCLTGNGTYTVNASALDPSPTAGC